MNSSLDILNKYFGCKMYKKVLSPRKLEAIRHNEKESTIYHNINNFLVSFRKNLCNNEKIDLMEHLDYFTEYEIDEYLPYLKKTKYEVHDNNEEHSRMISIYLPRKKC